MKSSHVVIGGGSGFIGSALHRRLISRGHKVTLISRTAGPGRITWDELREHGLPNCDAVVNLAGKHILNLRQSWNARYREELIASRVETTHALVAAINLAPQPPRVFVSTAGKCFYGTPGQDVDADYPVLDEYSQPMQIDYPAELVRQWEAAADKLSHSEVRHVKVRIGIVLGRATKAASLREMVTGPVKNGFMSIARLPVSLGLAAVIGHGRQPVSWIHLDDMVELLYRAITKPGMRGRYNAVAPGVVSNRQFIHTFAGILGRPVLWSVPRWLVKFVLGAERAPILLQGQNIAPRRTQASGFRFRYPELDIALQDLLQAE